MTWELSLLTLYRKCRQKLKINRKKIYGMNIKELPGGWIAQLPD